MELSNDFEVAVPVDEAWRVLTDIERIAPAMPGAQLKEIEGDEYRGLVKVKVGPITASYRGAARFEVLDDALHRAVLKAEGRETRGQGNASATIEATLKDSGEGRTAVAVKTELNITGKVAQFGRGVLADVSAKLLDQFVSNLETMVLSPGGESPEPVPGEPVATAAADSEPPAHATAAESEPPAKASRRSAAATKATSATKTPASGKAPAAETTGETEPATPATTPPSATETTGETPAVSSVRQIHHPEPEPVDLVDFAGPSLAKRLLPYASIAGVIFLLRIVIYALRRRKK
jgi:carbon monoxide dehydrogenase subunit G